MIPSEVSDATRSRHERFLFELFKNQLSDDYYVLHSFGVPNHRRKLWAEADFIVISPKGIFVLEVKGGGVSFENGKWYYISHDGTKHDGREGPWRQAKDVMYAVKKKIENDERNKGFAFGYGVILPDEDFSIACAEIDLNILLCKTNWDDDISKYINSLEEYWFEKNEKLLYKEPRPLDKSEREIIRNLLRPDIPTIFTLKSRINNIESRIIELTDEQQNAIKAIEMNPRTIITGGTGTGKTILAFNKAINLAREGKRVLFLCYNLLLADNLIENIPDDIAEAGTLRVDAIYRYMTDVINKAGKGSDLDNPHINEVELYSAVIPETYAETLLDSNPEHLYDVIIIDEAQDIMTEPILDAIELTLNDGLNNGCWHLFMDPFQDIYSKLSEKTIERLNTHNPTHYNLTKNCRNCLEIIHVTKAMSGIECNSLCLLEGGYKKIVQFKNINDFKKKLEAEIAYINKGELGFDDFIILSTKKLENSILSEFDAIGGYPVYDIRQKPSDVKSIDFCTMHAFKGLERQAVIAVDIEPPSYESLQRLLYTGLSRAKSYLTVFVASEHYSSFKESLDI